MTETPTKENPETIALRTPAQPVARLNRRMIVILAILIAVPVLLAIGWALAPHPTLPDPDAQTPSPATVAKAEGLARMPKDYSAWQVPQLGPPTGELGRPVLRAEQQAGLDRNLSFNPDAEVDHARVLRLRQQEEAEAAMKAKVFFQLSHRAVAPGLDTPSATLGSQLAGSDSRSTGGSQGADRSSPNEQFIHRAGDTAIYASGTLQTPRSPYELLAGTVIAAALLTGIDSSLPGEVLASVTEPVYDTVSGRYRLIPQGSRLIGQYDSEVAFGQRRVLLVWTRLIMPDGASIVLDRLPASDAQGRAGLEDRVDRHWGRIFAGAAISTLLGVNAELVSRNRNDGSILVATRNSAQDSVNQLGQELTRKNVELQPTLTIRPGFPIRILVNRDLMLRKVDSAQ